MVRKATTKRAKKPKHAHKQMENKLTQATPHQHPHHHPASAYDIMTKMSGVKSNPIGELGSLAPDLYDMIMHIKQSINLKQVKRYADVKKIPEAARTSLAVFFVDWGGNDLNHEEYLKNVPSGFSKPVALQMGDLLYWCMGGGSARQQWESIIAKTSENKDGDVGKAKKAKPLDFPSGMKMQDLTGLHVELLNMLPQKKYTHYTLNQLFLENRTIYDSLFDTFVALDPMEHDTLQVLDKIVKMGNIERFRLAMMHGTKGKIRSMLKEGTFGANLLEAFSVARKATEAYSRGEYDDARLGLERLQGEYGLSPDLFQLGLRDMFIIHAGAVSATSGGKDAKFTMKGSNIPLLVSIDKTVGPGSGWAGMKNIRDAMSGAAVKYIANGAIDGFAPQLGTPGGRIFQSSKGAMISTDWLYFFGALNTKTLKNLKSVKLSAVTEGDTTTPGLEGDQRTARLLIHARLDSGFEDLVPKGTLTVTVRPTGVDAGQAQRKADRRSVSKKGGKKKKNEEKKATPKDIIQIGSGNTQSYIGQVDLIFEDYGALFSSADKAAGGIYKDATKVSPKQLDAADEASAQDVQEMFDSMQPDAVSGTEEPTEAMLDEAEDLGLSRRGAKARMTLGLDYHDYIDEVKKILKKEGGAAGLKPLKAAFPKGTNKAQAQRMLEQMPGVVLHADGDYILVDTLANPAKGGGRSMGQTIVIELTPKSSIKPSTSREDAKWLKMVKKDSEGLTKLYNKFAKSSSRTPAQEGRVKKGKKKGEGITGGSYLVYKGGQTGLRMIKARRKDNNEFVPWLLMIPHILVRHGNNDTLEAKKGSASYAPTKELLELVELYFGKPKFKTNLGMGGFRLISERTARRLKQEGSAGKKVVDLALHEGVKKIFTTPGLKVGALKGRTDWSNARPSRYKSTGDISYQTRDGNGKLEFLEQSKKVKA